MFDTKSACDKLLVYGRRKAITKQSDDNDVDDDNTKKQHERRLGDQLSIVSERFLLPAP